MNCSLHGISVVFETMSGIHRPNRKSTDFTIARILGDDLTDYSTLRDIHLIKIHSPLNKLLCSNYHQSRNNSNRDSENRSETVHNFVEHKIITSTSTSKIFQSAGNEQKKKNNMAFSCTTPSTNNLHWLQCTRYRPPRLPRKSVTENISRRRATTHPRIPFTPYQLQVLEDKYKSSAYLSRKDVVQLSTKLMIPNNRIKIWFQNRRARDRRETKVTNSLSMDYKDM